MNELKLKVKVIPPITSDFGFEGIEERFLEVTLKEGETLESLLRRLGAEYPQFNKRIFDSARRKFIYYNLWVMLNGRFAHMERKARKAKIKPSDVIELSWPGG